MVSPELGRSLDAAGTPMIDLKAGVAAFLQELRLGAFEDTQVIYSGETVAVSAVDSSVGNVHAGNGRGSTGLVGVKGESKRPSVPVS